MTDAILFAQAPTLSDPSTWASGGIATVAIGAIWWLIRYYTGEIKEVTKEFRATTTEFQTSIRDKDTQIIGLTTKFDAAIREMWTKAEALQREGREEQRHTIDQVMGMNKDMVVVVEHMNTGQTEMKGAIHEMSEAVTQLKGTMVEVKNAVQHLSSRVDGIEPIVKPKVPAKGQP